MGLILARQKDHTRACVVSSSMPQAQSQVSAHKYIHINIHKLIHIHIRLHTYAHILTHPYTFSIRIHIHIHTDNDSSGTLQTGGLNAQLQHRHSLQYRFAALSALYGPLPQPTPDPVKIASQQSALRVDISAKTVFEQVHSVANRRPAVERNSRAQELRQLTGYQLRDIAIESMGGAAAGEVNLIKTYIAQTFTGADGSRLVVTHAVLDRACELSRLLERHIHACRVVKPDGCVEEVMLRLFSVVQCSGGNEGTQFGLLVQHLKPDPLASNESPQHPFEKHANHGFAVIPMNTVMSLTERYASVDPPPPASAASSSAAPARSVWVLPSRYKKSPHLRSSSGL